MAEVVTSRNLMEQVSIVRAAFDAAAACQKQANIDFIVKSKAYKHTYNAALVRYREQGSAVEIAKAQAQIAAEDAQEELDRAATEKSSARVEAEFCTETMRALSAISYVVNNETKMAQMGVA